MNDEQLLRYSRHLLLDEIDVAGQEILLQSHVLVIGAGGLGSAAAPYLAAAGVGHITLIDHDAVEITNLQRQIMHAEGSIGKSKVASGKQFLQSLNSSIHIETIEAKATAGVLAEHHGAVDAAATTVVGQPEVRANRIAAIDAAAALIMARATCGVARRHDDRQRSEEREPRRVAVHAATLALTRPGRL